MQILNRHPRALSRRHQSHPASRLHRQPLQRPPPHQRKARPHLPRHSEKTACHQPQPRRMYHNPPPRRHYRRLHPAIRAASSIRLRPATPITSLRPTQIGRKGRLSARLIMHTPPVEGEQRLRHWKAKQSIYTTALAVVLPIQKIVPHPTENTKSISGKSTRRTTQ